MRNLYAWGGCECRPSLRGLGQGISCDAPQQPALEISLMFGRNIGSELGVSEELWSDFVASEITPRFPHGLTSTTLWVNGVTRKPTRS
jgi:Protein of unknown function (DUF3574)